MIEEKEYFNGRVKSLGGDSRGQLFSVGIMEPGEYTFGTNSVEVIEIVFGEMEVALPDGSLKVYGKGETFTVEGERDYNVTVEKRPAAYLCLYK